MGKTRAKKPASKGYQGTRTEPVETASGYTLKPLKGREVKQIKKILLDNFEAVQSKLAEVEQKRVERQKELGPDVQLPMDNAAGMAVAEVLLEDGFDQLWVFLGSLIDKDLDEEPWHVHLEVLETLNEVDDFPNYVRRLWGLGQTFSSVITTQRSSDTEPPNGS